MAAVLLDDAFARYWGYDLSRRAHVRSGVLYPLLQRMLEAGWVVDGWEPEAETGGRRPPRRYYELTDEGREALGGLLSEARVDPRFAVYFAWRETAN